MREKKIFAGHQQLWRRGDIYGECLPGNFPSFVNLGANCVGSSTVGGMNSPFNITVLPFQNTYKNTNLHESFTGFTLICFQIIVGVCLLVGGGFLLMVWVELTIIWLSEKISNMFGKQQEKDPENPAALVGSFKRYK